ncbi:hypothetical protein DY120_01525 [Apilactobacillus micheneri]|uniref:Uncharacterized protein n=1 Tax=Apilactobacillus micheneri TaxID=1899430 RepID=A0ABY2YZB1_9LACO|nr:hypothetical protein [Apilactobacillus micheneri]TPR26402.1 hypothetical protein DY114_01525 [Apilactobacillus micheneri]TPR27156.1 hypothetical protein DY111_01525 [Apilactobacillus micheneri]TPR27403.1 hypothetical protein DY113_06475 [Apilactobacillus micheneri]TPR31919.1 hypothetical protein DY117_01525 [Apilactobacillus micheneri]TPR32323.1 hypothetical protein DY120_01525 [Apilactobacillus micheneri]
MKDKNSAKEYLLNHWNKHLKSLPKFNINVEKVFMENNDNGNCRVFAIVSTNEDNLDALNKEYMESQSFLDDMKGFNMENILKVEDVNLTEYL